MSDSTEVALISALQATMETALSDVNTAMPGKVVSVDGNRVVVKPTMPKALANGQSLEAPNIVRVPVVWPMAQGGRLGLTMPLRPGDGVLLVFSQRGLEGWLSGQETAPDDPRRFDLSDAIAIPGLLPNGPEPDTDEVQLFFNNTTVRLLPDGSAIVQNDNGSLTLQADGQCSYSGPKMTINADVQVNGTLRASNDVFAGTVSLHNHVHNNSGGTGIGGTPVP